MQPLAQRSEMIAVRDGLELHCVVWSGNTAPGAAPFLLVHGLASNARLWDGVARHLVELGHPVVAVDQRGHGHSTKPDDGFDMATVADDLALLIDALGFERPVVAGQSWGANVVVELAHRSPDSVRGVVAVDGGTIELRRHFPEWDDCAAQLAPPNLLGMPLSRLEAAMRSAHPDWPEEGIAGSLANMEVLADGTIRPWLTRDRHMKILRGLWEHDPHALFPAIEVPVLFMPAAAPAGTQVRGWAADKRESVERAVAALRRGGVSWFHGADHDLHAQHPRRVAQELHAETREGLFS
ncbi:MAG: alpha/beta hydrolase [Acidobacteria bacterium]|nr:alpha/beta hydrolase [Acidobacteriota bacterium]